MKKYLMTGIAAITMCAAFTSCSKDLGFEQMTPEQAVQSSYEAAFIEAFGQPSPDQDWGFGASATRGLTRGNASTNANMWADYGYDVPRELTQGQIDRVVAYFQKNQLEWGGSKDWTEFFVQQVYKGGTKPIGNKVTPNGYSAEEYQCANGGWITGGQQMDYLYANRDQSEHINNFNNGNGSPNGSVKNSPGETYLTDNGNGYHTDMIQLMVDSKAENFGYNNSAASKYYWDKYVLIDGDIIDAWATSAAGENVGESVSGRAFVGFDFEQFYKDEDIYTGSWSFNGKTYKYVVNAPNRYCGHIEKFNDSNKPEALGTVQQWLDDGYLPVDGTAGKEWAKVAKCADGYFSDWIVCIAPGHKIIEKPYQGRIMAEDLTVRPNGKASDFDFNDVVFDWKIEGRVATIQLRAIGGTLPLYVGGVEVHQQFGAKPNQMVNTGVDTMPEPAAFTYTFPAGTNPEAINIPIVVTRSTGDVTLTAERGKVASKINVPTDTRWVREYQDIKKAYPTFVGWIADPSANWTSNFNAAYLY